MWIKSYASQRSSYVWLHKASPVWTVLPWSPAGENQGRVLNEWTPELRQVLCVAASSSLALLGYPLRGASEPLLFTWWSREWSRRCAVYGIACDGHAVSTQQLLLPSTFCGKHWNNVSSVAHLFFLSCTLHSFDVATASLKLAQSKHNRVNQTITQDWFNTLSCFFREQDIISFSTFFFFTCFTWKN